MSTAEPGRCAGADLSQQEAVTEEATWTEIGDKCGFYLKGIERVWEILPSFQSGEFEVIQG